MTEQTAESRWVKVLFWFLCLFGAHAYEYVHSDYEAAHGAENDVCQACGKRRYRRHY